MACIRTAAVPAQLRRTAPSRSFFNLPSPFGSSSSTSSNAPVKKGTLVRRGPHWVYNEGKIMPYTPQELYTVIADVDSYHEFLPFTSSSRVLSATCLSRSDPQPTRSILAQKGWLQAGEAQTGDKWSMDAELRIGAMGFDEGYVSRVEMDIPHSVKATAKDASMFRHLVNIWSFTPVTTSSLPTRQPQTQVDLSLEYAFASPLHAAAISAVWDKVSALMVQKFEDRVVHVHGKR
ncbi:type II toxin-antitoxin system RatA family toxin [Sporobolomyces koalae]|uniref:type II toxin-antitoxin system RatA family toxin n=1 Tax=Sporobolomyces koalae TaxID=500713 RepID=UPI00317F90A9